MNVPVNVQSVNCNNRHIFFLQVYSCTRENFI